MYTLTYIIPATRTLHTLCTPNKHTAWATFWALLCVRSVKVRIWRAGTLLA